MVEGKRINLEDLSKTSVRPIGEVSADNIGVIQSSAKLDERDRLIVPVFANKNRVVYGEPTQIVKRKDSGDEYPVVVVDDEGDLARFRLRSATIVEAPRPAAPAPSEGSSEDSLGLAMKPVLRYDKDTGNIVPINLKPRRVDEETKDILPK